MKRYFVIFGVVIVLMLFAARKESGRHVDIGKVEHGRIVHWQNEKTTMLRLTSNATRVVSEEAVGYNVKKHTNTIAQAPKVTSQVYPKPSLQKLKSGQNNIATIKSEPSIWTCGWQTKPLYNYAFKNVTYGGIYSGKSNADDILLYDFGPCSHTVDDFKGTIYWFDGENHESFTSKLRPNDVYFGGKRVSVPTVDWAFVATASIGMGVVDKILASVRPAEIGKEFLLFMASNRSKKSILRYWSYNSAK